MVDRTPLSFDKKRTNPYGSGPGVDRRSQRGMVIDTAYFNKESLNRKQPN
jgi:hypothetical protein